MNDEGTKRNHKTVRSPQPTCGSGAYRASSSAYSTISCAMFVTIATHAYEGADIVLLISPNG
jgi:hypothetical protein